METNTSHINHIPTATDQLKADEAKMVGYDDLANKILTRRDTDGTWIEDTQHLENRAEVDRIVTDINRQKLVQA